jgi:hypothetical protein
MMLHILSSQNWIVSIPRVKFDTFPVDLLSLENIFSPPIDDLHSLLMDIAARIVLIGVICVAVPIYMILSESLDLMQCLPPNGAPCSTCATLRSRRDG